MSQDLLGQHALQTMQPLLQELFNLFFDDEIVGAICTYTILGATRVIQEINANAASNRIRIWKNVDPVKIRVFFGVLLIAEAFHC